MEPSPRSQPTFVQPNVWAPELKTGGEHRAPQAPLAIFEERRAPMNHGPSHGFKVKTETDYQYEQVQRQKMTEFRAPQEHPRIPAQFPAYVQGPFPMGEETHNTPSHAPTSHQEHIPMMMPTGVFDAEASAPALPRPAQRQPFLANHLPTERCRTRTIMPAAQIPESIMTDATLQLAIRRLAQPQSQRPAANPPLPRAAFYQDRSKRVRTQPDYALLHKGAPLPKTALLPSHTAAPSPAKPSTPKRRKMAVPQPPTALSTASTPGATAAPASARQALGRGSAESAVLLPTCKFVSKRTCVACPAVPRASSHKRGYVACCCSQGHQWVWCAQILNHKPSTRKPENLTLHPQP